MAWTAPMTAVFEQIFTATQFNIHVRDNLLETAPAKAATVGAYFVSDGVNSIGERIPQSASVTTDQSTTSTSYTDLSTVGPTVTAQTGSSALVFYGSGMYNNGTDNICHVSYEVSSSSTISATDTKSVNMDGIASTNSPRFGAFQFETGLTPGDNVFTLKYRVSAGTGNFFGREISVIPL